MDVIYHIMTWLVYYDQDQGRKKENRATKVLQFLALINIMIVIYDTYINSFNYYSYIQGLQYLMPATYLLIESFLKY